MLVMMFPVNSSYSLPKESKKLNILTHDNLISQQIQTGEIFINTPQRRFLFFTCSLETLYQLMRRPEVVRCLGVM